MKKIKSILRKVRNLFFRSISFIKMHFEDLRLSFLQGEEPDGVIYYLLAPFHYLLTGILILGYKLGYSDSNYNPFPQLTTI